MNIETFWQTNPTDKGIVMLHFNMQTVVADICRL